MRIVLINTLSWDSSITKHTVSFANALSNDAEVLLILRDEPIWQKLDLIDKNVKVFFIKIPRIFSPANANMIFNVVKIINEFEPDIIDLRSVYPWLCFGLFSLRKYPMVAAFATAKPRKGEKEKIHYKIAVHLIAQFSDQIITFGQTAKENVADRFKINIDNIHVIPFGNYADVYTHLVIDDDSNDNVDDDTKYVLFFGRIVEYKGLKYLIKSEPDICKKNSKTKIIIAGGCSDFSYYESIMKNRKSFIIDIKWIKDEMITKFFKMANVVVLPYIEYSESGIIQLAYAFKKPIVATNVGSIAEYIKDGETGFLVPPRDHKELARAIVKLLSDDELSNRMGEKGYNLMKNGFFSWDEIVHKVIKVYESAIEHRSN
jgi:glycosyltransferase involved in cell wall biosynthesis